MVQEQRVYWHLGHVICLKVLCRICYKQMPGGIWLLSRWLCWESIFYIWFFESIRPSVKLFVLQSREVKGERKDENKGNSSTVGTTNRSMSRFYFNCIFQVLRLVLTISPLSFKFLLFQSEKRGRKNKQRLL